MLNQLTRNGYVGVGTKDLFKIMDERTGEVTDKPARASQVAYMRANDDNFITLPGGGMMVKPEDYIAGFLSVAENTPGVAMEDYMLTKLLLQKYPVGKFKSSDILNHVNRSSADQKKAINQLAMWRLGSNMVDKVFPESRLDYDPLFKQVINVSLERIINILKGDGESAVQYLQDIRYMFANINKTWVETNLDENDISPLITGENLEEVLERLPSKGRFQKLLGNLRVILLGNKSL